MVLFLTMSTGSFNSDSVIIKILVIGDPCVGKTSFVQRYVSGAFSRHYKGTVGVDFALKIVEWPNKERLKVQLWDIAGQERFTCMTRVYYRDATGCIIMFDLTNRGSFLNAVRWKKDFDSKCANIDGNASPTTVPCILIANKCDAKHLRQVSKRDVENMCDEYGFSGWAEISVKDNHMVQDVMSYMLESIMKTSTEERNARKGNDKSNTLMLKQKAPGKQRHSTSACEPCPIS